MPNFFKKLSSGANNMFKKLDSGASNFFKKLPEEASNIAGKIGSGLDSAGNAIAGTAKKAGNFLEKNSSILADAGAGVAIALGQPELAPAILAAGNSGAILGQRLRQGGQQAQSTLNNLSQIQQRTITGGAAKVSNMGMGALGQARVTVNNANNTLTNLSNAASGLNQLTIH
jgi:hypothetical protein